MRWSTPILFLLPAVFAAVGCDTRESAAPAPRSGARATEQVGQQDPVSPVTGIPIIQRDHDMWAKIVAQQERAKKPDPTTVRQALKGIGILVVALERSIRADARLSTQRLHGRMTQELTRLRERIGVLMREVQEVETILAEAAKGIAPIPPGFTRAELEDTASDRVEDLRKLRREEDDLLKRLGEIEERLKAKVVEPPTETMATRELEAVKALRKRAQALRDR